MKSNDWRRFVVALLLVVLLSLVISPHFVFAQFNTPTVNGIIGVNEYGVHTNGQNQQTSGSNTWLLTWDATNLYVAVSGSFNASNDALNFYIDVNPIVPVNGGGNSNGSLTSPNFDRTLANLPFRADFFAFVKGGFDTYRLADGAGGWTGSGSVTKATNAGITEFSIPWNTITGAGKPPSFNWLGYISYDGGGFNGVFSPVPTENPTHANNNQTTINDVRYYTVSTTADGTATKPFSQNSYTHVGGDDLNFGAISVYDFTMNTSGGTIQRSSAGNWTIANDLVINAGILNFGATSGTADINGNVILSAGTLSLSTTAGGGLNVAKNWQKTGGTFNHNNRSVTFDGPDGGSQTIVGNNTFCNINVNIGTGATFDWGTGTTITIAGNLDKTSSGTMNSGTNNTTIFTGTCNGGGTKFLTGAGAKRFDNLQIADGATVQHNSGGSVEIFGNFTNNGNYSEDSSVLFTFDTSNGNRTMSNDGSYSTLFGKVKITGGNTLLAGAHDFTVTGSTFTVQSSSSFNGGTGTVTFAPDAIAPNLNSQTTIVASSNLIVDFHNIVIAPNMTLVGENNEMGVSGDFTNNGAVANAYTHNSGTVTFNGTSQILGTTITLFNNVVIDPASSLTGHSIGSNVEGNWTNNGTYTHNSGTIGFFNVTSSQTIGGSQATAFNNLSIGNGSTTGVTLSQNIRVNGVLTLGSTPIAGGRLTVGSQVLTLGSSASVVAGTGSLDASRMVVVEGSGALSCTGELRKEYSATGSFAFPVGEASGGYDYSPATINVTSGTFAGGAYAGICVHDSKHPNNGSVTSFITRYWTITDNGISNFSADLAFDYVNADINNAPTEASMVGGKWNGTAWTSLGLVNVGNNRVQGTVTGFSDYTAGELAFLPVTLSYFNAERIEKGVNFSWQTATETGNIGFNLYNEKGELLTKRMVLSPVGSSLEPQNYTLFLPNADGDSFTIEAVDLFQRTERKGPFALGVAFGAEVVTEAVDWATIANEHKAKAEQRATEAVALATNRLQSDFIASSGALLNLGVSQTGMYRLTHADLLAAGYDLSGALEEDVAITLAGMPIAVRVVTNAGIFNANSYLEFYGEAHTGLYTSQNIYQLHLNTALAQRPATDATPPTGTITPYYLETVTLGADNKYDVVSPAESPWYDTRFVAYGSSAQKDFNLAVDNLDPSAPVSATIHAQVWGGTRFEQTPDHHVVLELGGNVIADVTFDGLVTHDFAESVPLNAVQNGNNTFTVRVPFDLGLLWDVVGLDTYGITYPRQFVAKSNGMLSFTATGEQFQVSNLPAADVVVYRQDGGVLTRIEPVISGSGTFVATFAGISTPATYYVYSTPNLLAPAILPARPATDITSGTADYIMISHADFSNDLTPLVAHHTANGLSVKVVDVADIYDQFGDGVLDPAPIQAYIQHAVNNMGTQYILLVGGDTYDYADNLGLGSISFIPSPYRQTGDIVRFAPVDPLLADINGDFAPDVSLGRFPARTSAELNDMIAKSLAFANADYAQSAVFSADLQAERSFTNYSDILAGKVPAFWATSTAYLDQMSVPDAKSALLQAINNGVGLTSYIGHSGTTQWTWQNLFTASDANGLTNVGKPTVVAQWGCWNTYHVLPQYNTLGHNFMLGDTGAAAVLGATTLTNADHESALSTLFTDYWTNQGLTLGNALQQAKADLEASTPGLVDVQLGYSLLGDPALGYMACAVPEAPTNVDISENAGMTTLTWDNVDADHYEVWTSPTDAYFIPSGDCASSANCTIESGNAHITASNIEAFFVINSVNSCGMPSAIEEANRVGTFSFSMTPGQAE